MRIHHDNTVDTVTFTDFTNETNFIFMLLLKYFKSNNIQHIQSSNTIIVSRFDYDVAKAKISNELFKIEQ